LNKLPLPAAVCRIWTPLCNPAFKVSLSPADKAADTDRLDELSGAVESPDRADRDSQELGDNSDRDQQRRGFGRFSCVLRHGIVSVILGLVFIQEIAETVDLRKFFDDFFRDF
jgi:hypothetical protein